MAEQMRRLETEGVPYEPLLTYSDLGIPPVGGAAASDASPAGA